MKCQSLLRHTTAYIFLDGPERKSRVPGPLGKIIFPKNPDPSRMASFWGPGPLLYRFSALPLEGPWGFLGLVILWDFWRLIHLAFLPRWFRKALPWDIRHWDFEDWKKTKICNNHSYILGWWCSDTKKASFYVRRCSCMFVLSIFPGRWTPFWQTVSVEPTKRDLIGMSKCFFDGCTWPQMLKVWSIYLHLGSLGGKCG